MAHIKRQGTSRNGRDNAGRRLGAKKYDGEAVRVWNILIHQRGTKIYPGNDIDCGRDHVLFPLFNGIVKSDGKYRKVALKGLEVSSTKFIISIDNNLMCVRHSMEICFVTVQNWHLIISMPTRIPIFAFGFKRYHPVLKSPTFLKEIVRERQLWKSTVGSQAWIHIKSPASDSIAYSRST
jgi:large subunit ribosomal protein L27